MLDVSPYETQHTQAVFGHCFRPLVSISTYLLRILCVPIANSPAMGVFFHATSSCLRQSFECIVHTSCDAGQAFPRVRLRIR